MGIRKGRKISKIFRLIWFQLQAIINKRKRVHWYTLKVLQGYQIVWQSQGHQELYKLIM